MKAFVALFLLIFSLQQALGQWVVHSTPTTANLWDAEFVDRNTGWILGQHYESVGSVSTYAYRSIILRTTNAGAAWTETLVDKCVLFRFSFVDQSTGWAVGFTRGKSALICRTVDGGASWTIADSSLAKSSFGAVYFLNGQHGWVAGSGDSSGVLLRTTNGGMSWDRFFHESLSPNDLFFLNPQLGWMVAQTGKIYKTTDGGATWQVAFRASSALSPTYYEPLRRIKFSDQLHGCAVGGISGEETKVWTSDGGTTWNNASKSPGSSLHGLHMVDSSVGWTVGGANAGLTIQKTTDGGRTWSKQTTPTLSYPVAYFHDIVFVSATEGWIVADKGVILRTTNGGVTHISQNPYLAGTCQLNQNYPNPFNPSTAITFTLPARSLVSLKIFDALGNEIETIVDAELQPGTHSYQWNATQYSSGVYFYRLQAGTFRGTRKLVVVK